MFNSPIVSARYKYVRSLIFSFFDLIDKPSPLDEEKNDFLVTCLGTIIVRRSLTVFFILSVIFSGCFIESKEQILFAQGNSIYMVDSDGNNLKKIVSPNSNTSPSWSPKYDQILFITGSNTIASVNRDKLDEIQTYQEFNQNLPISNLQWSPNARYISFNAEIIYEYSTLVLLKKY